MSYYTESLKPRSEKITLVTINAVERLKLFNLNGADYERVTDNFIVGVKDSGNELIPGTLPLSLNEWHFEPLTKMLTINVGANPKTKDISVTYRLFFSNAPINLPYDLNTGEVVEWLPLISSVASIGQQLDSENSGIILESNSSVDLLNTSGHFDNIYDRYIFENQSIKFYSWFPTIPISEKILLFDGVIESKSFSETKVTLKVKDFVYKLKNKVNLGLFSELDGNILPSITGTAKRRIYGQADYIDCVSLDATLGGYAITGNISGTVGASTVLGTSTLFLDELSPEDEIFITQDGVTSKIGVLTVDSDTQFTASSVLAIGFSGITAKNKPIINWRKKNRTWQIAGHKLRAPSIDITAIIGRNSFEVSSIIDFSAGDTVLVNGVQSTIRFISGINIVTATNISPPPIIGNLIERRPINKVNIETKEALYVRDYTYVNSTYSNIILDPLAEFNLVEQVLFNINFTFTSASRTVTTASVADLRSTLKTRDWIKSGNVSNTEWYEVLEVKEQSLILRKPFAYSTLTGSAYYKNISYINENTLVTASCLGMEVSGQWIKTASDAVRHLVLNDAGFATINEASFLKAKTDCKYILSLVIPSKIGGFYTLVRDEITKINESIFGVLYVNSSHEISYSVFNSKRPESLEALHDDDILSFTVDSTQNIINEVKVNYSPYIDIYSDEPAFKTATHISTFVNELIGIKSTHEKTLYLYGDSDAEITAQRLCFFRSLSNSTVTLKTKMNLSSTVVNDKIYLSLDRLFKRYGGSDRRRLGVVSGIKKGEFGCDISITDLGNIYNRVMAIAPNSTLAYSASSDDDKMKWGYILDNETKTPDISTEIGLGSYLIG
jgi:hypothetical protein